MRTLAAVQAKMFEHRIDWAAIDRRKALRTPRVLHLLREACLVESYLPVYTAKMMALFWDDLDATTIFTIEAIEAYAHYYILRRYLDTVGRRPIRDAEVLALRRKERRARYRDDIRELVNFMGTEHFAARFFRDLARLTDEPVLRRLLPDFAAEETIHSQFALDLLEARVRARPARKRDVIRHALAFKHVGAYVMPSVSPATADNLDAIQQFNQRFEPLLGRPLSDFVGRAGR